MRLRVLAAQRFAREDHGARVDLVGMHARGAVGGVDDLAHAALVDALLALVGRERDRRLVERLARHHEVAARELLRQAAHVHAREDDLRSRGADVDAHRKQREVVLQPERVALRVECAEVVVIVVVVVVGIAVVGVQRVLTREVIFERVLFFRRRAHQILKLSSVSGAKSSSGARSRLDNPCSW
jgi:hypothetical protein